MCHFLKCHSAITDTTKKLAPLLFTVSGRVDQGFPHSFWRRTDHRHLHGLQHQHMPWISAWFPVAIQTMDINVTLCSSIGHRYYQSPQWQHKLRPPTWPLGQPVATWFMDFNMASDGITDHEHLHGFWW